MVDDWCFLMDITITCNAVSLCNSDIATSKIAPDWAFSDNSQKQSQIVIKCNTVYYPLANWCTQYDKLIIFCFLCFITNKDLQHYKKTVSRSTRQFFENDEKTISRNGKVSLYWVTLITLDFHSSSTHQSVFLSEIEFRRKNKEDNLLSDPKILRGSNLVVFLVAVAHMWWKNN